MRNTLNGVLQSVLFVFVFAQLSFAQTAGSFGYQVAPVGAEPQSYSDLFSFLAYDIDRQKWHIGEDWNRADGADYGQPIYAIADGKVEYAQSTGSASLGKQIIVVHTMPNGAVVKSVYLHVKDILVAVGATVTKGQKIATIGDAEGYYSPHVHVELRMDPTITSISAAYYAPLAAAKVVQYACPSLFIDDRAREFPTVLTSGTWTFFQVPSAAPGSTAYIETASGARYSIKRAVDAGIISASGICFEQSGSWYRWNDVSAAYFETGRNYAAFGMVANAKLIILRPAHNFKDKRSIMDMARAAKADSRFAKEIRANTYAEDLNWSTTFELRRMQCAGDAGATWFNQATTKANPLVRYTCFYDISTGQWSAWVPCDINVLQ